MGMVFGFLLLLLILPERRWNSTNLNLFFFSIFAVPYML